MPYTTNQMKYPAYIAAIGMLIAVVGSTVTNLGLTILGFAAMVICAVATYLMVNKKKEGCRGRTTLDGEALFTDGTHDHLTITFKDAVLLNQGTELEDDPNLKAAVDETNAKITEANLRRVNPDDKTQKQIPLLTYESIKKIFHTNIFIYHITNPFPTDYGDDINSDECLLILDKPKEEKIHNYPIEVLHIVPWKKTRVEGMYCNFLVHKSVPNDGMFPILPVLSARQFLPVDTKLAKLRKKIEIKTKVPKFSSFIAKLRKLPPPKPAAVDPEEFDPYPVVTAIQSLSDLLISARDIEKEDIANSYAIDALYLYASKLLSKNQNLKKLNMQYEEKANDVEAEMEKLVDEQNAARNPLDEVKRRKNASNEMNKMIAKYQISTFILALVSVVFALLWYDKMWGI